MVVKKLMCLKALFILFIYGFVFSSCNSQKQFVSYLSEISNSPKSNVITDETKITLPNKQELLYQMQKVADWQIDNFQYSKEGSAGFLHDYGIDAWTNATLFLGLSNWAEIATDQTKYYNWLINIGDENNWKIPDNFKDYPNYSLYHADELCIGQFYLDMYDKFKVDKMKESTKKRIDWIINNPPNDNPEYRNKQSWTWIDALFMAPPVYAKLAIIENDPTYNEFMHQNYMKTVNYLYNDQHDLFYRDSSYFDKKEENGEDVFWGRGNGWMAASLANILKILPQDAPDRIFYQETLKRYLKTLLSLKDENNYWHASLLDPSSYPAPETSATSLIAYALAYAINEDILSAEEYGQDLANIWQTLNSFVDEDGKLGYVQPIGANPKSVTRDMTSVYGIGAYLLAGREIFKMVDDIN